MLKKEKKKSEIPLNGILIQLHSLAGMFKIHLQNQKILRKEILK